MTDPRQPGSPTQGEADDASGPDPGRRNTDVRDMTTSQDIEGSAVPSSLEGNVDDDDATISEDEDATISEDEDATISEDEDAAISEDDDATISEIDFAAQDAPVVINIGQRLAGETAGEFDFESNDDSVSFINSEDDFEQILQDYERANDRLEPVDDFPTEPAVLHEYVREIAQALTNWDGAIDLKNAKGKPMPAVNRIKRLKKSEIVILAWMVLLAIRDAQRGISRGVWGDEDRLHPQKFDSWKDRYQAVIRILKIVKQNVLRLIRERKSFAYELAAHPKAISRLQNSNRAGNKRKADEIAVGKAAKKQSSSSSGATATSIATGNPQGQRTPNALESSLVRDAGDGQGDAASSHPIEKKRKQSSTAPSESAKPPATPNDGIEAFLRTSAADKTSKVSSPSGSFQTSRQGNTNVASTSSARSGPPAQEAGTPARTDASQPAAPLSAAHRAILKYRAAQHAKAASATRTPLPDSRGHKPQMGISNNEYTRNHTERGKQGLTKEQYLKSLGSSYLYDKQKTEELVMEMQRRAWDEAQAAASASRKPGAGANAERQEVENDLEEEEEEEEGEEEEEEEEDDDDEDDDDEDEEE